ncbi:tyrosine-type recombinase/integrase [Marinifilum flexuosum]|uniref:tyrosine-type recombinase/integrase n=1 Tax=Marinifilum flexuosum TaxID=1117708 RepID=UPI002494B1BD|nr:tyrosine-type recombinase/integrase [Marinifilum flexuosum]
MNTSKLVAYRGKVCIYYKAGTKDLRISTGVEATKQNFNSKTRIYKGDSKIQKVISDKKDLVDQMIQLDIERHGEPNIIRIKSLIENPPKKKAVQRSLHDLMDTFIEFKEFDPNCGEGRLKTLYQLQNTFKKCIPSYMLYDEFTTKEIMKYEKYLRKTINAGTLRKRLSDLKEFFNHLVTEEGFKTNPHIKKYKLRKFEPDFVVLNEAQMAAFEEFKPHNDSQQRVRDIFTILLHTGMSIGDYEELKPLHIQNDRIIKRRKKTKTLFDVPLHSKVTEIINRYNGVENLPKIVGQAFNRQLRNQLKLIKEFQHDEELLVDENKYETKPFYQWVSSHCGRHTFIDRLLRLQTPYQVLMQFVGHKTVDQLIEYAKKKGINGEDKLFINML